MPRVRTSPEERQKRNYTNLLSSKAEERGIELGEILGCCERTARERAKEPGSQRFDEVLNACRRLGIGIIFYDKEQYEAILKMKE